MNYVSRQSRVLLIRVAFIFITLGVGGCAQLTTITPEVDADAVWQARLDRLSRPMSWKMRAAIAGSSGSESFSTRFLWIQNDDRYVIQLFDPIGRVVAKIDGDKEGVDVRFCDGHHVYATDPDAAKRERSVSKM